MEIVMEELLLGILAAVLIASGGAGMVTSLVGMAVVLYRRLKASRELTALSGDPGTSETA